MKHFLCLLLFVFALSSRVGAADLEDPWDFHGLVLGSSEEVVLQKFPGFQCESEGPVRRCKTVFNFAEHPGFLSSKGGTYVSLVFASDKLVNVGVMLPPAVFDEAYSKVKTVYGTPLSEKSEQVSTKDGRSFENKKIIWHKGVSTILYDKYYGNVGTSRLLYMTK